MTSLSQVEVRTRSIAAGAVVVAPDLNSQMVLVQPLMHNGSDQPCAGTAEVDHLSRAWNGYVRRQQLGCSTPRGEHRRLIVRDANVYINCDRVLVRGWGRRGGHLCNLTQDVNDGTFGGGDRSSFRGRCRAVEPQPPGLSGGLLIATRARSATAAAT